MRLGLGVQELGSRISQDSLETLMYFWPLRAAVGTDKPSSQAALKQNKLAIPFPPCWTTHLSPRSRTDCLEVKAGTPTCLVLTRDETGLCSSLVLSLSLSLSSIPLGRWDTDMKISNLQACQRAHTLGADGRWASVVPQKYQPLVHDAMIYLEGQVGTGRISQTRSWKGRVFH